MNYRRRGVALVLFAIYLAALALFGFRHVVREARPLPALLRVFQ